MATQFSRGPEVTAWLVKLELLGAQSAFLEL